MLIAAQERGEIRTGDSATAGDHFVGMIRGNLHLQVMLGLRGPPEEDERKQLVESVVDIFLGGVGYRNEPLRL